MSNKYDWIKAGVHAWIEGLVCPVEVEVYSRLKFTNAAMCDCGKLNDCIKFDELYQTEAECLEAMKKKLFQHRIPKTN